MRFRLLVAFRLLEQNEFFNKTFDYVITVSATAAATYSHERQPARFGLLLFLIWFETWDANMWIVRRQSLQQRRVNRIWMDV